MTAQGINQWNESLRLKFISAQLPGEALEVCSALTTKAPSNDCSSQVCENATFALIERAEGGAD